MVDLKCEREDCKYNKACNCMANGIDVSKQTECTTYEKSDNPNKHEEDKIPQALIRHNTNVRCVAPCLFENDCLCIANGITVENLTIKNKKGCPCPACATYLPK